MQEKVILDVEDECQWECQGSRGMWMTKQDWKGDYKEIWATCEHNRPQKLLYLRPAEGGPWKVGWLPETFGYWHEGLTWMGRSRSSCPPKVPGLQTPIYPSFERGLCSGTAGERAAIQAGQMAGRKQLPTAAGSSKKPGKSSQNTATSNYGTGKAESWGLGRKRRREPAAFAPFGQRHWAEKSPCWVCCSFCSACLRKSVKNYQPGTVVLWILTKSVNLAGFL